MARLFFLLTSSLLPVLSRASSHDGAAQTLAPAGSDERHCFAVCSGPSPASSVVPSIVTCSGLTLTVAPIMLPTMASIVEPISGNGGSDGNNNGSGSRSGNTSGVMSPISIVAGGSTSLGSARSASSLNSSRPLDAGLVSPASSSAEAVQSDPALGSESGLASGSFPPSLEVPSLSVFSSGGMANASMPTAVPATAPPNGLGNPNPNLSPLAVDAIQLMQFVKNLVSGVLHSNGTDAKQWTSNGSDATPLARLVADIEQQEQTQLSVFSELLVRAGAEEVPPCQYTLPANATELLSLLVVLKDIELGVSMTLVDGLSSEQDTHVSRLLSGDAGDAAEQSALLRAHEPPYGDGNDGEPFKTPASGTWAYSFVLGYVRPGSCAVELPLPILPALAVDGKAIGQAQPGTVITFSWDPAGKAAASRLGNPLFVGWVSGVNAPIFTSLTTLGDGTGTSSVPPGLSGIAFAVLTTQPSLTSIDELTAATLAGPVVVRLHVPE